MSRPRRCLAVAVAVAACAPAAACGDDPAAGAGDRPTVVVTTSILGDVVERLAGDEVDVEVVMPRGADPHEFQPSARQVARLREADALVVNGGGFEEGLDDVITAARADGVPTFVAVDHAGEGRIEDVHRDGHADEAGGGEADHEAHEDEGREDEEHEHDADAHFFTDPDRMAAAAAELVAFLAEAVGDTDPSALRAVAAPYLRTLEGLAGEVEEILAGVPPEDRVLVTTHGVLDPFAERFGFDVLGTVVPSGSTADGASAKALADLADRIEQLGIPAIFADTSSPSDLAGVVADEAGDVALVDLYTESLGAADSDGATYADLVRTNARRIASALARAGE